MLEKHVRKEVLNKNFSGECSSDCLAPLTPSNYCTQIQADNKIKQLKLKMLRAVLLLALEPCFVFGKGVAELKSSLELGVKREVNQHIKV